MAERIERIALYAVILILALAVGYLAWTRQGGDSNGDVKAALDGINASLAATVDGKLAGLEERVANSVYDKLRQAGKCELTENECAPDAPPAMSVASNFTLLHENARLNEARQVAEESVGIRLAPRHRRRLDLLANAFRACQRRDEPVRFRVTGYSSTAEFRVKKGTDAELLPGSDELNLKTANLRAAVVGAYLENLDFSVTTKQWESFKDLPRPYLDDTQPGMDQQALNRTVFIEVLSAGACDLGRLSRPAS